MSTETQTPIDPAVVEIAGHIGQSIAVGDMQAAYARAARLCEECPDSPAAHSTAGLLAIRLNLPDGAALHFGSALRLAPEDYVANYNLALLDLQTDNRAEALGRLRYLRRLNPDDAALLNDMGVVWEGEARPLRALAAYTRALRIDPEYSLARNNAMKLCLNQGWIELAHKVVRRSNEDTRLSPLAQAEIERWEQVLGGPPVTTSEKN